MWIIATHSQKFKSKKINKLTQLKSTTVNINSTRKFPVERNKHVRTWDQSEISKTQVE